VVTLNQLITARLPVLLLDGAHLRAQQALALLSGSVRNLLIVTRPLELVLWWLSVL